jgi:hypothetical protein
MVRRAIIISLLPTLLATVTAGATTYAVIEGHEITDGDVIAAVGYVPSNESELAKVVKGLVERKIILGLAERKGTTCTDAELDRTMGLIADVRGANKFLAAEDYRNYVREEIIIGKYIDEYVYPQVSASDEDIERLFLLIPGEFVNPVPATRSRLKEIFPLYRNAVYNRYVKIELARILRMEVEAVEKFLEIKYYVGTDKK